MTTTMADGFSSSSSSLLDLSAVTTTVVIGTTSEAFIQSSETSSSSTISSTDPVFNVLSGNHSETTTIGEVSNSTSASLYGRVIRGPLEQWQIILIASLCAAAVVIVVAMVLIWKLCGKKPGEGRSSTTRDIPPSEVPASSPKSKPCWGCCPKTSKMAAKASEVINGAGANALRPQSAHKKPLSNEYQQNPSGPDKPLDPRTPLPPITGVTTTGGPLPVDQNAALQGAAVMPRRLAPMTQNPLPPMPKSMSTDLTGGTVMGQVMTPRRTGGVYAPIQQQQQQIVHLRGVPMMPVAFEHRRPLPPPPPPE